MKKISRATAQRRNALPRFSGSLINQMVQHHVPVPGESAAYYG